MDIAIRDTIETDLPDIFRIRTDPRVTPHQHKLRREDTIALWEHHLFGNQQTGPLVFKCTTITRQDEIIGHISQHHYDVEGQKVCYCGWNIAPAYWGQGNALIALAQLFDNFFCDQELDTVISDCFSNNTRCIRVMNKLEYLPGQIRIYERMVTAIVNRSFHRILRFYLSAERWQSRNAQIS